MNTAELICAMIAYSQGNTHDIEHFLKVTAYAKTIGEAEHLDPETQTTLEYAAVVHDIACPYCREKYGNASGRHQEDESEALLRPFFAPFTIAPKMLERIIFLVTHHHTTENVVGLDYQILLEADYLVNASESHFTREHIEAFRRDVMKTDTGKALLDAIYPNDGRIPPSSIGGG